MPDFPLGARHLFYHIVQMIVRPLQLQIVVVGEGVIGPGKEKYLRGKLQYNPLLPPDSAGNPVGYQAVYGVVAPAE